MRILGSQVDRLIAVSDYARDAWIELGLDSRRLDTVYCGIALERYPFGGMAEREAARTALGLPAEGFIALYFGRLDPDKCINVLLEAWGRLTTDPAQRRLVLLGSPVLHPDPDAYQRELKAAAPPSCVWMPMRSDVVQPLHAADIVVQPTRKEALGRVVLEGLATGRPVLASRVGGIPEILTDELSRFLVEPEDVVGLTRGMESLMNWRTSEPELARTCFTRVADHPRSLSRQVGGVPVARSIAPVSPRPARESSPAHSLTFVISAHLGRTCPDVRGTAGETEDPGVLRRRGPPRRRWEAGTCAPPALRACARGVLPSRRLPATRMQAHCGSNAAVARVARPEKWALRGSQWVITALTGRLTA